MQSNDLFRLVALRQSRTHDGDSAPSTSPPSDPRLRHRDRIAAKSRVELSKRTERLNSLKAHHAELTRTVRDLESVQRVVIKVAMMRQQQETRAAPPPPPTTGGDMEHGEITAAAAPPVSTAETFVPARAVVVDEAFKRAIEGKLVDRETKLFRNTIASMPTGMVVDLDDLLRKLDVAIFLDEANTICTEIGPIEESLAADLPTVGIAGEPTGETAPIVSAVGWGELIVARETLVGYNAREIAHIENILPGESKLREHQRIAKTEQVDEVEIITERETEKDSQTTDRYELQVETQETIQRDFSLSAGVNTSGRYGLTQVDTSLDTAFAQSQSQSRSAAMATAREIVTKSLERTLERVRKLRRLTLTEEIKELNRHELSNVGSPPLSAISGMYLWVEKIQRIELRHYGTRMMIEFHIPEPAVSLLEVSTAADNRRRLPPFDVGPTGVDGTNYMCLAQRYGALDVQPPPTQFIHVGFGWVSTVNEEAENWAEDQFTEMINVPEGYTPEWARVAWAGLQGTKENRAFNFAFAVGGISEPPAGKEHTVPTYNGVVLQLPTGTTWPQGVPVSGRVHGSWDGAMYVQVTLTCRRTPEAYAKWRIATWASLRAGYEALARQLAQEQQAMAFESQLLVTRSVEGPAEVNRKIERDELQKWAIKSLRLVPQNFNAIEQVGEQQEMSPLHAEAEAPIVRFYENAFEWEHMNYFLYPYHWARRATWAMRSRIERNDVRFQAFLQAGAARVIVPVTPGYEDKVMSFLDQETQADELSRILAPARNTVPDPGENPFRDVWIELLTEYKSDLSRGSGTLAVTNGGAEVTISPDSKWRASDRDKGREIYIAGDLYTVGDVVDDRTIRLDRAFEGASDPLAPYAAGSVAYGPAWTVNIPTTLVVLSDNLAALRAVG
jgi:hypothetical protein